MANRGKPLIMCMNHDLAIIRNKTYAADYKYLTIKAIHDL